MEDNRIRIKRLLEKKNLTHEDRLWLLNYLENSDHSDLYYLALEKYNNSLSDDEHLLDRNESKNILSNIHRKIQSSAVKKKYHFSRWSVAASIALVITSSSLYYYFSKQASSKEAIEINSAAAINIAPGSNKAALTLADGSTILLDDAAEGKISEQGNTFVYKTNGTLSYNAQNVNSNLNAKLSFNTLTTPRGGQYKVVLPDSTVVWLNAESSIRFPTKFSAHERNVSLTGEAYFEVATNKSAPFKVNLESMEVEVLGTHFNVMAYSDEKSVNTTLIEGSVKIHKNQQQKLLRPGQQARVSNTIKVSNVDVNEAIAWKNGLFQFKEANIETILRQIGRWYDVKIEYQGEISDEKYRAEISRKANLSQVLKILEISGLKFSLKEGRTITVKR